MATVDHVFVLVLENRSFDHFFGLSGRPSIPRPSDVGFGPGATDRAVFDPPHEFEDVQAQIAGGSMSGFDNRAKLAFEPSQLPVISQLAQEFVLFDNWFASVPGPTWPNRFFIHAASSGGLSTSPTQLEESGAVIRPGSSFKFQNGTLFDRLAQQHKKWRVYHGDIQPQVLALPGMVDLYLHGGDRFCPLYDTDPHFSNFAADVGDASYEPAYTFIEPSYAIQMFSQFAHGESQHPLGRVSAGEALIRYVYESLRNSPLWSTCALLVTWDEHGGFFDHVDPPSATPPGDPPLNAPPGRPIFGFDRLGVRVPALLISPLAPRGKLGSELFPGQAFDHASIAKSVFENFGLGPALTARDASAPSWNSCLAASARSAGDAGPTSLALPPTDAAANVMRAAPIPPATRGVDGFLAGMALIAVDLDRQIADASGKPALAHTAPQSADDYDRARSAAVRDPAFQSHVVQFVNEVSVRVQGHRARTRQKAMARS